MKLLLLENMDWTHILLSYVFNPMIVVVILTFMTFSNIYSGREDYYQQYKQKGFSSKLLLNMSCRQYITIWDYVQGNRVALLLYSS